MTTALPIPPTFAEIRNGFERAREPAGTWEDIAQAFAWVDVEVSVSPPPGFAWGMPVLVALRGALGVQLREAELDDVPEHPDAQASAAQVLFRSMGHMTTDYQYPKPFVLQGDPDTGTIRVRLFGPAMIFATEISSALTRVVTQRSENPFGRHLDVAARRVVRGKMEPSAVSTANAMGFLTPLSMRKGGKLHSAPRSVLVGLAKRVAGVLAWQGVPLPVHYARLYADLAQQFAAAKWDDGKTETSWKHPSARQKSRFSEGGVVGRLLLGAEIGAYGELFAISQAVHCGAKCAIGCGRFEVATHPDGLA